MSGKDLTESFGIARFEECVAELTDPRGRQGRWYPLSVFVAVALAGLLCGKNTPSQWARWAADAPDAVVRALGGIGVEVGGAAWWSLPSYNRLVEVLSGLDPDQLARFAARIVPRLSRVGVGLVFLQVGPCLVDRLIRWVFRTSSVLVEESLAWQRFDRRVWCRAVRGVCR